MNESLIEEWNSKVGDNDIIFFLGDFSFKGQEATKAILERLNGYKIMVLGNHDKKLRSLYEQYFDEVHEYLEISYNKIKICMMHFPISCWNRAAHGSIMLHGHTHGSFKGQEEQ
jgi:calcineurin-like phosphoesterase family protein